MGHQNWPVGQAVKTPPFHGGIASSILARVTKNGFQNWNPFFCVYEKV